MKWGVIGQGAIGSLYAYYLRSCANYHNDIDEIAILHRAENGKAAPKLLRDMQGKIHLLDVPLLSILSNHPKIFDILLICVKHYHLEALIPSLASWMDDNTCLVLVQNGMGGAERLQQVFPNNPILVGVGTDALYPIDSTTFQIAAQGRLDIGLYNGPTNQHVQRYLELLGQAHPNLNNISNIESALYAKLAINAVINSLSALKEVKNGELLKPIHSNDVDEIEEEIFALYQTMTIDIDTQKLKQDIREVMRLTANNTSSMLQDIKANRQTEIDGILGFMLKKADDHHIKMPKITQLYRDIKLIEASNKKPRTSNTLA